MFTIPAYTALVELAGAQARLPPAAGRQQRRLGPDHADRAC